MLKASLWSNRTFQFTPWHAQFVPANPPGGERSRPSILDVKRFGDHAGLFALVDDKSTNRRTGAGIAARVGDVAAEKLP